MTRLVGLLCVGCLVLTIPAGAQEVLVIDDPLDQSTIGVQEGGVWDGGGGGAPSSLFLIMFLLAIFRPFRSSASALLK